MNTTDPISGEPDITAVSADEQAPERPQPRRRNPALIIVAAVLFVASAALGTVWLMEKSDHSKTTAQLETVRRDHDAAKAELTKAQSNLKDAETLAQFMSNAKAALERNVTTLRYCVEEANDMFAATTDKAFVEEGEQAERACLSAATVK